MGSYTFGDAPLAEARLELVARTFAPASVALLRARAPQRPRLVADLGCGPGHTSAMLEVELAPERLVALDSSQAYVAAACARGFDARVADVTRDVGAIAGADVVYARFLLTHLADVEGAIARWRGALAPGGVLLLEEVDAIACPDPGLAAYLELQRAMLAAHGHELDVGARLHAAAPADSAVARLPVPAQTAAQMFAMNFAAWREDAAVAARATESERAAIADDLRAVAAGERAAPDLEWSMRQVVVAA